MNIRAVLVDDEVDDAFVKGIVKQAAPMGLEITSVAVTDNPGQALVDTRADVLIMDMKLANHSARKIARDALRRKPNTAVFFWTKYAGDSEFEDLDRSLNPLIRCAKGTKVPRADRDVAILETSLIAPVRALVKRPENHRALAMLIDPGAREQPDADSPFRLTVDDMLLMSLSDARRAVRAARAECKERVDVVFANSDAEWLLVAGPDMDVIRWGVSVADIPDAARVEFLGRRHGYMPFVFSRPVDVDDLQTGSTWSDCPPTDFYPCLGVHLLRGSSNTFQVHFDTGAPRTFLSYESLWDAGGIEPVSNLEVRSGNREPNQPFEYVDRDVDLLLSDGFDSQSVTVRPWIVFDWSESPFARRCPHGNCPGSQGLAEGHLCGRREAGLLGRDLLVHGRMQIVLDGANQQTRFLKEAKGGDDFPGGSRWLED